VPLVLLERAWWAGLNGIYLVRFGFRMWEILILKWFSAAENSNKSQKARFWKEKWVEDVVLAHISNLLTWTAHKEHITFQLPLCLFQYFQVCNVWSSVSNKYQNAWTKSNECAPMLPVSLEQSQWIMAFLQRDRLP